MWLGFDRAPAHWDGDYGGGGGDRLCDLGGLDGRGSLLGLLSGLNRLGRRWRFVDIRRDEQNQAHQEKRNEQAYLHGQFFLRLVGSVRQIGHDDGVLQRTGSNPPSWNGWQRNRRRVPIQTPRAAPYLWTASIMYSEQVGWKRQADGKSGEMKRL